MTLYIRRLTRAASLAVLLLAAATTGTAAAATAPVLYGAAGGGAGGGGGGGGAPTLYTIDPATAASTAVGPIGFQITGLAVDPTTGILYGATGRTDTTAPSSIITIDKATGAGTLVGAEYPGMANASPVADITFLSSGQLIGWSENGDLFVTIDKTTGMATETTDTGLDTYGDGMSVDRDGRIFAMLDGNAPNGGTLRTIDPATGATTLVAPLSGAYNDGAAVPAASFGCDRTTLYAVDGLSGSTAPDYLATVNTTTGEMTPIGTTSVRLDGLEWDCPTELGFDVTSSSIGEGAGNATVTVKRFGGVKGEARVSYATADGTATAGQDYTSTSGTLVFADNETTRTIAVPIIDDTVSDPDETFSVRLSAPTPNSTLAAATRTVTIVDDEPAPAPPPAPTPPPVVISTPVPVPVPVTVTRRQPRLSASVTPKRDRTSPYRFTTRGKVLRPSGVSIAAACTGKVRVRIKAGKLTISSRLVSVRKDCSYRSTVKFSLPRRVRRVASLSVSTRFGGNAALKAARGKTQTVRIR